MKWAPFTDSIFHKYVPKSFGDCTGFSPDHREMNFSVLCRRIFPREVLHDAWFRNAPYGQVPVNVILLTRTPMSRPRRDMLYLSVKQAGQWRDPANRNRGMAIPTICLPIRWDPYSRRLSGFIPTVL